jgi:TolA-binding protein
MSSDRCEDLLLDIATGALGDEQARVARSEVEACAEHADALRRVELGLRFAALMPIEEPSPALDAAILAAARAKHEAQPVRAAAAAMKPDFLSRALTLLRRMATGPQLAMSTVMLLVVAIGLWYLPAPAATPNADGDTVMAPRLAEMPPPAPAPLAEAEAPTRREEGVGLSPRTGSGASHGAELAIKPAPRGVVASGRGAVAPARQPRLARRSRPATDAARTQNETEPLGGFAEPLGGFAEPAGAGAPQASRRARVASAPAAASAPPSAASVGAPAEASAEAFAAADESELRADEEARRAPASSYDRAMTLYRSGRYTEAAPLFEAALAAGGAEAPSAAHYLARSHRSAGRCALAVHDYERLLRSYPSYGQRTQAMVEAADCYERTGRVAQAEQWLERAASASPSSIAARRELDRLRARSAEPPAEPAGRPAGEPTE